MEIDNSKGQAWRRGVLAIVLAVTAGGAAHAVGAVVAGPSVAASLSGPQSRIADVPEPTPPPVSARGMAGHLAATTVPPRVRVVTRTVVRTVVRVVRVQTPVPNHCLYFAYRQVDAAGHVDPTADGEWFCTTDAAAEAAHHPGAIVLLPTRPRTEQG